MREDKVCRESKEVHRENRMICSVQGLCIDLVYFALLSFSTGWACSLSFQFFLQGSFLAPNLRKEFHRKGKLTLCSLFSVTSLFCVLGRKLAALHGHHSNELFRMIPLLTVDAVNSVLNPIMSHDMQASW